MRSVTTLLPLSVHLVVGLSTLMLGFAQGSLFPYVLAPPILIFSLVSGIRWPRLQISVLSANVLGLLAFGLTFAGLMSGNTETRLLAGAHLLVYLSWIVLLQSKRSAQYWWLLAIAVLEVAVGAILTHAGLYGGLLIVFLFLSIWTLSLFSLYQAGQRFLPDQSAHSEEEKTGGETDEKTAASPSHLPASASLLQASSVQGSIHHPQTSNRWFSARYLFGIL
ncbi:MAG: hypothetical protein IID45_00570, partial [Planctomycetes bacterium]|nr:hypothetical protein [Planctomycetota bacterium]